MSAKSISPLRFDSYFRRAFPGGLKWDVRKQPMAAAQKLFQAFVNDRIIPPDTNPILFVGQCLTLMNDRTLKNKLAAGEQTFYSLEIYEKIVKGRIFEKSNIWKGVSRVEAILLEIAAADYGDFFREVFYPPPQDGASPIRPNQRVSRKMVSSLPIFFIPGGQKYLRAGIEIPEGEIYYFMPYWDKLFETLALSIHDSEHNQIKTMVLNLGLGDPRRETRIFEDREERLKREFKQNNQRLLDQAARDRQQKVWARLEDFFTLLEGRKELSQGGSWETANREAEEMVPGTYKVSCLVAGPLEELPGIRIYKLNLKPGSIYEMIFSKVFPGGRLEMELLERGSQRKPRWFFLDRNMLGEQIFIEEKISGCSGRGPS